MDVPRPGDAFANVLCVDRDELARAVIVHLAGDGTLQAGVEPAAEDRRSRVDVRRVARFRDDEQPNPVRINAVEAHEVNGRAGPDVDRELVSAVAVQVRGGRTRTHTARPGSR